MHYNATRQHGNYAKSHQCGETFRKVSLYIKWLEVIPERRTAEEEFNGGTD